MRIIIEVDDGKVLDAVNAGFRKVGYSYNSMLEDVNLIDVQDIATYIMPSLDVDEKDIEIERD